MASSVGSLYSSVTRRSLSFILRGNFWTSVHTVERQKGSGETGTSDETGTASETGTGGETGR